MLSKEIHRVTMLTLVMFFLFLSGTLHAAIQKTIHFQGFLTDSNDEAVMDNTYQMTFSLWNDSDDATATKIWEETRSIAVSRGIYSVNLGESNPFPYSLNFSDLVVQGIIMENLTLHQAYM